MATTVEKKTRPDPVSRVSSRRSAPPAAPRSAPLSARPPQRSERSDRAQLSSESSQPSAPPTPRVSSLTRGLAEAYGARGTARASRSEGDETVRVGTYNIGAGNEEASTEENFERTRGLIADEIVHGGSEVINLQEVGVDGRLTGGRDNNQEILESVFVEELGDEWRDADLSRVSLDEDGKPVRDDDNQPVYDPEAYADTRVTATNDEGQRRNMDVTRQRYNDQGEPVDWSEGPAQGHVVSYEAEAAPGKNYTLVFGSSSDGGTYGNGVLLAPGHEVTDVERRVLGQDDPDNGDDEYRTALGVTFTTPGGQTVSTVSAHLTNGQQESRGNNRNDQYHALDDFVEDLHQDDRPVIVGGDFNSRAGGQYAKEWYDALPFIDPPRHPSAGDLGWNDPDRDNNSIDRLYTVGGVEVGDRQDYEGQGGSDHDYVAWDVAV